MSENRNIVNSKSGVGVGSASIMLIFAVLCLTIFTLITYIVAGNNKTLVDREVELVAGFYEADALAERILAEVLTADAPPAASHGIDIQVAYDEQLGGDTIYFYCPVSTVKALYVNVLPCGDTYHILSWRMVDTDAWSADGGVNVWSGG